MPNHVHGVIIIIEPDNTHDIPNCRGLINQTPTNGTPTNGNSWILMKNPKNTLGKIIIYFKAKTSKIIHDNGFEHFQWQRNYYEHIIRSEKELNETRQYILGNPQNWYLDEENPDLL